MMVRGPHLIAAFVGIIVLIGAAFSFGMQWKGAPESQGATAAETVSESPATTSEQTVSDESNEELYAVTKVIDGDTIAISKDGKTETVRLIGIDTPETVDTRVEVQCFGKESSDKLKSLLSGKKVSLEIDDREGERDKYKRMLAYVFRDDGLFINKYMIEEGYAYEYTYDTDYKYQNAFMSAEASAKAGQNGLWKPDACPKPEVKGDTTAATKKEVTPPPPPAATTTPQPEPKKEEPQPLDEPEPEEEPAQAAGNYTCASNKYNCTDFSTHAEAQAVFDQCGGAENDVHKLDSNKDGEACESLP